MLCRWNFVPLLESTVQQEASLPSLTPFPTQSQWLRDQNISSWKRPIRTTQSSSLPLTTPPTAEPGWQCCPDAPWGLVLWPHLSGACSSAWSAPRTFPCCPIWASLGVASLHFFTSYHRGDIVPMPPWGAGQQDQSPTWCSVIVRVNTVLCPFWCPFKYSKKDKNLESISDLTESLSE